MDEEDHTTYSIFQSTTEQILTLSTEINIPSSVTNVDSTSDTSDIVEQSTNYDETEPSVEPSTTEKIEPTTDIPTE